jgi:hypothetical protein
MVSLANCKQVFALLEYLYQPDYLKAVIEADKTALNCTKLVFPALSQQTSGQRMSKRSTVLKQFCIRWIIMQVSLTWVHNNSPNVLLWILSPFSKQLGY